MAMPTTGDGAREEGKLRRALGTPALTFFGVGMILGAGIYAVIGAAAGEAGGALWASFAAAALVALLTGLSYAELAAMHPRAGAEFVYLREAAPRWPALGLTVSLLVALSGLATCATVALAFADYLGGLIELEGEGPLSARHGIALALLGAAVAIAAAGILQASWVNVIFTLIEIAGLALVVLVAARSDGLGQGALALPDVGVGGVLAGAGLVFFSFLGFENVAALAEEAKEPARMVPRAVIASIAVSGALYVLVALAAVALMPPSELAESSTPLASAVARRSPEAGTALSVIALFATANTCLASLVVTSRLLFGVADAGALPRWLARTSGRKAPVPALAVGLVIAAGLTFLGEVPLVASLSSLASLSAFFAIHMATIALRLRAPEVPRPFRAPLSVKNVPITAVVGALATLGLALAIDRQAQLAGLAALAVVALIATLAVRARPRSPAA